MARLFGTDGVRGIANADLTCEMAYKIGQAGAYVLTSEVHKPRILIGRDTRISGDMLLCALSAGICSVGAEAANVGVIPTPGIAHITSKYDADAGVVISASHNSFEFNGIKLFNSEGFKLSDAIEDRIERIVKGEENGCVMPIGVDLGRTINVAKAADEYMDYLVSQANVDLTGLNVVLDCANGAASEIAPRVFERLGATVHAYSNMPDGSNINANCGSTHPQRLQQIVTEKGADIGLAFDGDADRLIAVDEFGVLVDGDRIMAICAMDMKQNGKLKKNTLVATVMSNLGMILTLKEAGIEVLLTDVGDRYVLERMIKDGYNLGGEQSGHVIFLDDNTTGDGILTGIRLMGVMARNKERLSALSHTVKIFPQVLVNIRVDNAVKYAFKEDADVAGRIAQTEEKLSQRGRILARTSGTEPIIRIMIEGEDEAMIDAEAIAIAKLIEKKFNGKIS